MTSIRVQKLLDALDQAGCKTNRQGDGWQAQCPVHEDDNPSLSIKENSAGEIGIYCHAGCDTGDILKELGLKWDILFPDGQKNGGKVQKKIVKTYPYVNEQGETLFEVVRFHPKDFRQRQPQAGGGWKYSMKGVRRVVYNLPEVLQAGQTERPIFIVEGEKDADALIKRNLVATTCAMGAGKWKDSYNEFFAGAEVIILPDNDRPGKEHAIKLTGELISHVKSIRIVDLPGLNEKEDVSDWLMQGGSGEELLELAFNTAPITSVEEAQTFLDTGTEINPNDPRNIKDLFFEENHKIYSNDEEERVIADFNIDIKSIVKDDREGQIFYIKINELDRGRPRTTETIEVKPEYLDDLRSFYKAIRPYSMGEILQYRSFKVKPLNIFKWLLQNFDKPIVRRPDHVGHTTKNGRPFWIFGNAVICPPWGDNDSKIVKPNQSDEFIINDKLGFTLPLYDSEVEKEQLAPYINTNIQNIDAFLGEVKTKIIDLIGGGDPAGKAGNYGKLLLAYVIYHLYERDLYHVNDVNGHTVMFYVHGPKGTGKTTYFNTVLRAFFGLQNTKSLSGNSLTVPGIENIMSMYSQLPVCYDEFNPESSNISYQNINGYYHKTARSVSDTDRKNRNKFTNIRSTFSITSNYRINLDVDQADATQSRTIYFQYKKEYRNEDEQLFKWMKDNLGKLSSITTYLLLTQTDEKRKKVKEQAETLKKKMEDAVKKEIEKAPGKYAAEHRITDNYTRLLACYELIFGRDNQLRSFIKDELLERFAFAQANKKENALINQLIFLASSGRLKESWHYHYNNSQEELYIDINQCYQSYEAYKRDKAISLSQFREILKEHFERCGGAEVASKRWHGKYYNHDHDPVDVHKVQHSYILTYRQVLDSANQLADLFPPKDEHREYLKRMSLHPESENETTTETEQINIDDEAPF